MRYLISYDLMAPGKDYSELWTALRQINAVRVLDSQWVTNRANTTPLGIANYCLKHMDSNDRILVAEMPDNYGHKNLLVSPQQIP